MAPIPMAVGLLKSDPRCGACPVFRSTSNVLMKLQGVKWRPLGESNPPYYSTLPYPYFIGVFNTQDAIDSHIRYAIVMLTG